MAAPIRRQKTADRPQPRKDETFAKKLLQQTHAAGSNREPNAHFVTTGKRADEQQIAHVRAGDE